MGFIDEIMFWGSNKPRITPQKFKRVRSNLAAAGFSVDKRNRLEGIFSGDMNGKVTATNPKGIDEKELEIRLKWLKNNKSKHNFTDQEIDKIEECMKKSF